MAKRKLVLKSFIISFVFLSLPLISGCPNPMQAVDRKLSQVNNIKFPLNCRAEIVPPLGSEDTITVFSGLVFIELDNSGPLIGAAKMVFGRIFKEVDMRGEVKDPHFVIKVKSDVEIDPTWATYNVNVESIINYGDGSDFGSFSGKGSETTMVLKQVGLNKAYLKAYAQVLDDMISDANMINLLAKGVDETKIRKTADVEDNISEYQEFIDGVVTIELKKLTPRRIPESLHGSGFFIDDKGTILTSSHIISEVKNADTAKVLYKQKEYDFNILSMDEWNDLALIKVIDLSNNSYLELLPKNQPLGVGDEVIVVGSPMATELEHTVSKGIISSFRQVKGYRLIQTDAAVNPGNSGGPMVCVEKKKVIGLVSLIAFGEGLGFAIPFETIHRFLEENSDKY
jgi:S1-C subfamily serine protease